MIKCKKVNMAKRIFFLLFAIAGIGIEFFAYSVYKDSQDAKAWPMTAGRVISSEIHSHRSHSASSRHSSIMYSAGVAFEYSVAGRTYTSKKISLGECGSSSRSDAQKVVDKYPQGKEIAVYYNPANPGSAMLEPGKIGGIFIPFIVGAMFIVVGILGAVGKKAS
ncbi:MAG: DUF3592 domain-containing protein [Candidatus Omnitrophica bacterium]|nr:DUF3592 domain-containing protein [Candidatus Omnitrophota bacterium]MDD5430189.1 DUF3592 domain-containing protein [Candidatus Omnitrophota bacterium]